MASISSTNTSILPPWPSDSNSTSLRDVSFSSYLNSSEEYYIRSLVESTQTLKKKVEDVEIDVFSADKYFNETKTHDKQLNTTSTETNHHDLYKHHHQNLKEVINQPRTPSNQSESSSWNSQSALLRRARRIPSRNSSYSDRNSKMKAQSKRLFLPCCSCSDKSCADVEDDLARNKITRNTSLKSIKTNLDVSEITKLNKLHLQKKETSVNDPFFFPEEEKRQSLDVFGSNDMENENGIVERRLKMLSWDAIPRFQTEDIISNAGASGPPSGSYNDTESDASSDLFEIECLSCTANPVVTGPQGSSEGPASPTTCYAPSEASIEWSVVTASAADFSAFSDCEDQRSSITSSMIKKNNKMTPKMIPSSKMPSMLLGCKSQKAVRVAGEGYRTPVGREKLERDRRQRNSLDSVFSTTRFQAEAKLSGFGQKPRKEASSVVVSPRPPPRWSPSSDLLHF